VSIFAGLLTGVIEDERDNERAPVGVTDPDTGGEALGL